MPDISPMTPILIGSALSCAAATPPTAARAAAHNHVPTCVRIVASPLALVFRKCRLRLGADRMHVGAGSCGRGLLFGDQLVEHALVAHRPEIDLEQHRTRGVAMAERHRLLRLDDGLVLILE